LNDIIGRALDQIKAKKPNNFGDDCRKFFKLDFLRPYGVEHQYFVLENAKKRKIDYGAFLFTNSGCLLFTRNLIQLECITSISLIPQNIIDFGFNLKDGQAITYIETPDSSDSERDLARVSINLSGITSPDKYGILSHLEIKGRISLISKKIYQSHVIEGKLISQRNILIEKIDSTDDYVLIGIGDYDLKESPIMKTFNNIKSMKDKHKVCATQLFLESEHNNKQCREVNELEKRWIDKFGGGTLLYS